MIIAATPLLPEAARRRCGGGGGEREGASCGMEEAAEATDQLMRAIVLCDEDGALEALDVCGGVGRTERETGYTALHHAAEYGLDRLAAALADRGAALGAKTRDLILQNAVVQPGGQTPLHLAARSGEAGVVELLLARGADPSAPDVDGVSPAVAAALRGRGALAERLARAAQAPLPSPQALEEIAARARDAGRLRAKEQLEVPPHLRQVYTMESVWPVQDCERVLAAVQAAARSLADASAGSGAQGLASGWTTERHAAYATTDLPCSAVPAVDAWVRASLRRCVLPQLARRHGWLPHDRGSDGGEEADGSRLAFRDLFFVRYSAAAGGQPGLALHRDGSVISFNILLNPASAFDGGGTFIEADARAYHIGQGDCFVHSGKLRHGGHPITRGERYVLVGFVDVLDDGEQMAADDL